MEDYTRLVSEARDGLDRKQSDLAEEERTLLGKIERGKITTRDKLDAALREPTRLC
jgi:ribosome-binding protein aMBF1 (putative translation factor)